MAPVNIFNQERTYINNIKQIIVLYIGTTYSKDRQVFPIHKIQTMKLPRCTRFWKKWQKILVAELVGRLKSSWVAESDQHPWKRCWPSSWKQVWKHLSHRLLWTLRRVQSETRRAKRKSPQVRWPFLKGNSLLQSYSSKNIVCSLYQT